MTRAVVVHFDPADAERIAARIRREGLEADALPARALSALRALADNPPDAIVLDLSRQPYHARYVAGMLRQNKSTRRIPLVFLPGDPEKTRLARQALPDAFFAKAGSLRDSIEMAIRKQPAEPMLLDPTRVPLAGKLRIGEGVAVALLNAPDGFRKRLEPLPARVHFRKQNADVVLRFVKSTGMLAKEMPGIAEDVEAGRQVWLVWPKKSSALGSDITMPRVGELCSTLGLSFHRICAVDETWSALGIARRRKRRVSR